MLVNIYYYLEVMMAVTCSFVPERCNQLATIIKLSQPIISHKFTNLANHIQ